MNAISKRNPGVAAVQAVPVPNDPTLLASYFRQVESYQTDKLAVAKRSTRIAWTFAGGSGVVAAAACLALAGLERDVMGPSRWGIPESADV